MIPRQRYALIGFGLVSLAFLAGWLFSPASELASKPAEKSGSKLSVGNLDVPIVMHTSGGRLEVATVTATETFKSKAPARSFLGIDLGETVSEVRAKVVYRYYIEMAKEWPVRFKGNTAIVEAGDFKPGLPVAFDTSTLQKETSSGWARFNKHDNLLELEKRMSPELERRCDGYRALARPYARKTVAVFAKTWLANSQNWKSLKITEVKVVFPGEPIVEGTTLRPQPEDQ